MDPIQGSANHWVSGKCWVMIVVEFRRPTFTATGYAVAATLRVDNGTPVIEGTARLSRPTSWCQPDRACVGH
jgi:hypothetical protein